MPQSSVNVKGQITLPKAYRKKYGIHPRDIVTITDTGDAIVIRKARSIFELEGSLGKAGSQDEERKAAMEGAARHAAGDEK
jgi:AbrB family looped-hinge helix DNA binding protein